MCGPNFGPHLTKEIKVTHQPIPGEKIGCAASPILFFILIIVIVLLIGVAILNEPHDQGDLYNAVGNYCGDGVVWQWDFPENFDPYTKVLPGTCLLDDGLTSNFWVNLKTGDVTPR